MGMNLRDVLDELLTEEAGDELALLTPRERPCACAATLRRGPVGKRTDRVRLEHKPWIGGSVSVEVFLDQLRRRRDFELDALAAGFIKHAECPGRRFDGT
jgi:hypothetical protein